MQNTDNHSFSKREIASLIRLLDSGTAENIQLALSIFEGNAKNQEVLDKIKKEPILILQCLQKGHQNILAQFRFIYLRRMGLTTITANIQYLKHIIMLDLGYNQLHTLPREIYALKSLKKLRLHHNQLKNIDSEISLLQNLEELVLDSNQIQTLPSSIFQLKNLKRLGLAFNQLSTKELKRIRSQLPHIQIDIS